MHPTKKLVDQLYRLADIANASSVALFLPAAWESTARALLLEVGTDSPLAELASQQAAEEFSAEVAETGRWAGAPADADGIVASRSGDGMLIPVPLLTSLWAGAVTPRAGTPRRRQSDGRGDAATAGWVGLRFAPSTDASAVANKSNIQLAHSLASTVVSLYGLLTDPLTGLPGRNELHGALRLDLQRARRHRLPCALVLVNPIGLDWVNSAHGRRAGDGVVREVVQVLQSLLRRSDVLDALRRRYLRAAARQRGPARCHAGRRTGAQPGRRPRVHERRRAASLRGGRRGLRGRPGGCARAARLAPARQRGAGRRPPAGRRDGSGVARRRDRGRCPGHRSPVRHLHRPHRQGLPQHGPVVGRAAGALQRAWQHRARRARGGAAAHAARSGAGRASSSATMPGCACWSASSVAATASRCRWPVRISRKRSGR